MRISFGIAAVVLLAAACGDTASTTTERAAPTAPDTTPAPTATEAPLQTVPPGSPTTASPTTAAPTTVAEGVVEIDATVYEGQVDAGGRVEVRVGDLVVLRVTSDVADEVHVHGYDLFADVGAGGTALLEFSADIPGIFEVELEGAGLELLELVVEP